MNSTAPRIPARFSAFAASAVLMLLAVSVLTMTGCSDTLSTGLSLLAGEPEPAESLLRLDEAAIDRDQAVFGAYFDIDSVAAHAYAASIEELRQTPEYADMVAQLGEAQAEEILKEDILPYDSVEQRVSAAFDLAAVPEGEGPFGAFRVTSSDVGEREAELVIASAVGGQERTYVLGMVQGSDADLGQIWRVAEIKNITDLIDFRAP